MCIRFTFAKSTGDLICFSKCISWFTHTSIGTPQCWAQVEGDSILRCKKNLEIFIRLGDCILLRAKFKNAVFKISFGVISCARLTFLILWDSSIFDLWQQLCHFHLLSLVVENELSIMNVMCGGAVVIVGNNRGNYKNY